MLTVPPHGQISFCSPELQLLAEACELWLQEHESSSDELLVCYVTTLATAFAALAKAEAFEMHITPAQQEQAMEWARCIVEPKEVKSC